jgi:hypothetical protein
MDKIDVLGVLPFQACLFAPYLILHQIVLCDFSYSTKEKTLCDLLCMFCCHWPN